MEELKNKIKTFLEITPIELLLSDQTAQDKLAEYYYLVFGEAINCSYCPGSVNSVVSSLLERINNTNFNFKTKKLMYKLKPSKRVYSRRLGIHITKDNLTPGNAEALLAENPKNLESFETYPDDWQERADAMRKKLFAAEDKAAEEAAAKADAEADQEKIRLNKEAEEAAEKNRLENETRLKAEADEKEAERKAAKADAKAGSKK